MILGVDEANYSPSLAGDCVVCSLAALEKVEGVKDSKQLSKKSQLELFSELQKKSVYSIVPATVNSINTEGIYKARNRAVIASLGLLIMELKDRGIGYGEIEVIIDGYWSQRWKRIISLNIREVPVKGLIHGDSLIYEISAASIVARVYADALFGGFGLFYPGYRLERSHGSPDPIMYEKLYECGPTPMHRTSYGFKWWKLILGDRYEEYFGGKKEG